MALIGVRWQSRRELPGPRSSRAGFMHKMAGMVLEVGRGSRGRGGTTTATVCARNARIMQGGRRRAWHSTALRMCSWREVARTQFCSMRMLTVLADLPKWRVFIGCSGQPFPSCFSASAFLHSFC